jgi:DNA-binding NarL/FixJ family response regulator
MIRVLLADDHNLFRAGFRALLEKIGEIQVVAEAGDGRQALSLIEEHQPDVVLMDIAMPELNGIEVTARVAKKFPSVRVVLLSMHSNEEYVRQAVRAGAAGYILKGASIPELELMLQAVSRGETYLSPAVSKPLMAEYTRLTETEPGAIERLTPRQREVLQLIAEGYSRKAIAGKLQISVKTFDTIRLQLMEALDIHDNAGLIRFAIGMGLV